MDYLRKILNDLEGGVTPSLGRTTLAEYLAVWLDEVVAVEYRATSKITARRNVRLHINPHLGRYQLTQLSPARFRSWIALLRTKGRVGGGPLAGSSVRRIYNDLHAALQDAVDTKKLRHHPMEGVARPQVLDPIIEVFNRAEASLLLKAAQKHRHGAIAQLALETGMRRSELLGLRWSDVSIREGGTGRVRVRQVAHRLGRQGGWVFEPPKSDKGRRSIAIGRRATASLQAWREEVHARHAAPPVLVFPAADGNPVGYTVLRNLMKSLCRSAGVPHLEMHALRHTHATLLLEAGVNVKVVSERLGHSDTGFTMNTYVHFLADLQEQAAHVTDEVLSGVAGDPPSPVEL